MLGKFRNILRKLPHKSVYLLNDFEDIAVRFNPEEKSKFIAGMKGSYKKHPLHHSTNVVTWALLEAIEETKEEHNNY
jgi:hypothetical protein